MDNKIEFSRLLKIFRINRKCAYIIELKENKEKHLYISYESRNRRYFVRQDLVKYHQDKFKNLSKECLMKQCVNADGMFKNSPITHFEADCSNLYNGYEMFFNSNLKHIKSDFTNLGEAISMFYKTKLNEVNIDFPKLVYGTKMFQGSSISKITSQLPNLVFGHYMFYETKIKEVSLKLGSVKQIDSMFENSNLEYCDMDFSNIVTPKNVFYNSKLKKIKDFDVLKCDLDLKMFFNGVPEDFKRDHPYYFV